MHIWVDADACPAVIKDILFRAANRMQVPLTLVANRLLRVPPSPYIRARQVPMGFDVADRHIVVEVAEGDLVITADIPLAAALIENGAFFLSPRGERHSAEYIRERLGLREGGGGRRSAGAGGGGPAARAPARR